MEAPVIALGMSAIQVAVVYFGIYTYNLDVWRMGAAIVAMAFAGSLLMHRFAPPSQLIQQMKARLANKETATTAEIGLMDVTGIVVLITTAYMLITRYGVFPWFGIYVISMIASLIAYFL
jgi:hypothetical protein